ncbi:hypothetical protein LTS18_006673 [Coniosporium uncinatum]|uniref:Uncharacterized protein n=1 Tax=Coniosporium uncinatum TaxID=93489 RepID=A0ACC3DY02_9PEZI|nr:hypothetical protein LTS18_006673 [Coniosporium uncinatum]
MESFDSSASSPDPISILPRSSPTKPPSRLRSTLSPSKFGGNRQRYSTPQADNSSPVKSMVLSTGKAKGASPWRIKVTVEAEPQMDESNAFRDNSPVLRSRTMTVPLRDSDDLPNRERARKTLSDRKKGTGTPVGRLRTRRSVGLDDGDMEEDQDYNPAKVKRRRGRPRKSVGNSVLDSLIQDDEASLPEAEQSVEVPSSPPSLRPSSRFSQRQARVSNTTVQATARQTFDFTKLTPLHAKHTLTKRNAQTPSPTKRLRERRPTPVKPSAWKDYTMYEEEEATFQESEPDGVVRVPEVKPATPMKPSLTKSVASMSSKHASGIYQEVHLGEDEREERYAVLTRTDTNEEPDAILGTVRPSDDDEDSEHADEHSIIGEETFLQSQDFSMVSVESLQRMRDEGSLLQNQQGPAPSQSTRQLSGTTTASDSTGRGCPPQLTPGSSILSSSEIRGSTLSDNPPAFQNQHAPQQTPALAPSAPSGPPAFEASQPSSQKLSTPEMTQVQKIGSALQDVTKPASLESSPSRCHESQISRLGTPMHETSSVQSGTPRKADHVFLAPSSSIKNSFAYPRLLTPEESDNYKPTFPAQPCEDIQVAYPSLSVQMARTQLVSPERSDDEIVWQAVTTSSALKASASSSRIVHALHSQGKAPEYDSTPFKKVIEKREVEWQRARDAVIREMQQANSNQVVVLEDTMDGDDRTNEDEEQTDDAHEQSDEDEHEDIWNGEDKHESNKSASTPTSAGGSFHTRGLTVKDSSFTVSSQRNLTRPTSGSPHVHFAQNQNEVESGKKPTILRSSSSDSDNSTATESSEGSIDVVEGPVDEPMDDAEDTEDDSDTGNFFMNNLPAIFSRRNRRNSGKVYTSRAAQPSSSPSSPQYVGKQEAEKLDLTMLLSPEKEKERPMWSESMLKNPLKLNVLRTGAQPSSPVRGSPLRKEMTLPGSSPPYLESTRFDQNLEHSSLEASEEENQDASFNDTTMSDVRQLRNEIAAQTSRSANAIPQHTSQRSHATQVAVNFGSFVFEEEAVSRSLARDESLSQTETENFFNRSPHHRRPLFDTSAERTFHPTTTHTQLLRTEPSPPAAAASRPDFLSRLGTSLFTALIGPTSPPPPPKPLTHPTLTDLPLLPAQEPWTKTHYKVLAALLERLYTSPASFDPRRRDSGIVASSIMATKTGELAQKYTDLVVANWGYEVHMTYLHTTLVALYCQLLVLPSMEAYEEKYGESIELGDPYRESVRRMEDARKKGKKVEMEITAWEVLGRLFSVIVGEQIRKDERAGKPVMRGTEGRMRWEGSEEWVPCAF